jgi:hypothetical protein
MRVFKLAKSWQQLNYFLATMASTINKIASFTVLLCLFIFMFVILGMELFANVLRFNYNNEPVPFYGAQMDEISKKFSIPD